MTVLLAFSAKWVTEAHTLIGSLAFVVTLFVGWAGGLWQPLCTNSVASKWRSSVQTILIFFQNGQLNGSLQSRLREFSSQQLFPSIRESCKLLLIQSSIGDHAPPRALFHILIALCATPRFLLLLVQWLVHRNPPCTSSHSVDVKSVKRSSATLVDIELLVGLARTFCW